MIILSKTVDAQSSATNNQIIEEELQSYEEAYNHPDKIQWEKWRSVIKKKSMMWIKEESGR